MSADIQLPFESASVVLLPVLRSALLSQKIKSKVMAPESRRIMVKLAASIVSSPNASRHKTELAANAIRAHVVKSRVFAVELLLASMSYLSLG